MLRFSVYNHNLVIRDDRIITRNFIVLKDDNNIIVAWTDFHKYIKSNKYGYAANVSSNGNRRPYYICKLLNHVFFNKYHITKLTQLTIPMVQDFLNRYGMGELEDNDNLRGESTVNNCVRYIMDFLEELLNVNKGKMKFNKSDLYTTKQVQNQRGKLVKKKIPVFDVTYIQKTNTIFRDMPEKAFSVFMKVIIEKHTNILMLVALSAFAGLRPSESCNVRREDSALGPGLMFTEINGDVEDIEIDLRKELNLRSDLKVTGGIKKERMQKVYPAFRGVFCECYQVYMKYIEGKKYESNYGALTTNKQGKAITYASYYGEFKKVVEDVIPELLSSDDQELVYYGHLLMENSISPHIFRHWYSVKLTLFGEDVAGLMYWRGDRSPNSSLTYLQNKGDLEKQYIKMNNNMIDYQLWASNKLVEELK